MRDGRDTVYKYLCKVGVVEASQSGVQSSRYRLQLSEEPRLAES